MSSPPLYEDMGDAILDMENKIKREDVILKEYQNLDRTLEPVVGKIWLTYSTQTYFIHKINDMPGLVDKGCLVEHPHDLVPIKVKICERPGRFIDFKTIKNVVEDILTEGNGFKGKIGLIDTEHFASELRILIAKSLRIDFKDVRLEILETSKYGVEIE